MRISIKTFGPLSRASLLLMLSLVHPSIVRAAGVAWLDDVVQDVVREARAGGRAAAHEGEAAVRGTGRLFGARRMRALRSSLDAPTTLAAPVGWERRRPRHS